MDGFTYTLSTGVLPRKMQQVPGNFWDFFIFSLRT